MNSEKNSYYILRTVELIRWAHVSPHPVPLRQCLNERRGPLIPRGAFLDWVHLVDPRRHSVEVCRKPACLPRITPAEVVQAYGHGNCTGLEKDFARSCTPTRIFVLKIHRFPEYCVNSTGSGPARDFPPPSLDFHESPTGSSHEPTVGHRLSNVQQVSSIRTTRTHSSNGCRRRIMWRRSLTT